MTDMTIAPATDTPPAAGAVSSIRHMLTGYLRRVVATLVGLCALVALPGTALATTEPITPGSGADRVQLTVSGAAAGWGTSTLLVGLVVVVLLAAAVAGIHRIAQRRRTARRTVL